MTVSTKLGVDKDLGRVQRNKQARPSCYVLYNGKSQGEKRDLQEARVRPEIYKFGFEMCEQMNDTRITVQ